MTDLKIREHQSQPLYAIRISNPKQNGKMVVGLRYDGRVDFGPGITPDTAAREFYQTLAKMIHTSDVKATRLAALLRDGLTLARTWPGFEASLDRGKWMTEVETALALEK